MDLDALRTGLAARLAGFDDYAEIFDPFADTKRPRSGSLTI